MESYRAFRAGDFARLNSFPSTKPHNAAIAEYFANKCANSQALLDKLSTMTGSYTLTYNQAVLAYQLQQYGRALTLLSSMKFDESSELLMIRSSFLKAEILLSLDLPELLHKVLSLLIVDRLEDHMKKTGPFIPLVVCGYLERDQISVHEFRFLISFYRCRLCLAEKDFALSAKAFNEAKSLSGSIFKTDYPGEVGERVVAHIQSMLQFLAAQVSFLEANSVKTSQELISAALELDTNHPYSQKSDEKIAYPVALYNDLMCLHLREAKPNLARLYASKAFRTLSNAECPKDSDKPQQCVTYYSSQKRAELTFNLALTYIQTKKPSQALTHLLEVASIYGIQPIFWYRMAQCFFMLHVQSLENERAEMKSDIYADIRKNKYLLPAKTLYRFTDDFDNKPSETPLEKCIKCLKSALLKNCDAELKVYVQTLLAYSYLYMHPQLAYSLAHSLGSQDIVDKLKFNAYMYAAEAQLQAGKFRVALDYLSPTHFPKEFKIRVQSTLSQTGAIVWEELSSKSVQYINLCSCYLQNNNLPLALQTLTQLLNYLNISFTPVKQPSQHVPAPVINLCIYISLRLGNHSQAAALIKTRRVFDFMTFLKSKVSSIS
mmetsp:Transcript_787/g.1522  ORF Transcript_787/g.1522 Transcript_787/m.1522 type:complete len:604 (-) Transcript_787:124-1935(-)